MRLHRLGLAILVVFFWCAWLSPVFKGSALPRPLAGGHVGIAAVWKGERGRAVDQALDAGDGLPAAPVGHQDGIALRPQPIVAECSPAVED